MDKTDPNYCPNCGIHRFHASPGCEGHGAINPLSKSSKRAGLAQIDATQSDEFLLNQFTDEAVADGYEHDVAVTIARGRIENLRNGGDGYSVGTPGVTRIDGKSDVVVPDGLIHGEPLNLPPLQPTVAGEPNAFATSDISVNRDAVGGVSSNVVDPQRASTTTAGEPTRALGDEFDSRR